MIKKTMIIMLLFFFLLTNISSTYSIETVSNEKYGIIISNSKTFYVGGCGAGNYSSIQAAINDASNGDLIFVYDNSSPYFEKIIIDKEINLTGENRYTTIIDADESGDAVRIICDGVQFYNFTVQNTGIGNSPDVLKNSAIEIISSDNHIIKNNICIDTNYGIWTEYSNNNVILNNNIYGFYDGISLDESKNNILKDNIMFGSGLVISGSTKPLLIHDIDTSNIVNGKPVYYYKNQSGLKVPQNAGEVIIVNCSNFIIENLEITNVTNGMEILYSNQNNIRNNSIFNTTDFGIRLEKSNNNNIKNNNISYCSFGIGFCKGGFDGLKENANCKYNLISNNTLFFNDYIGIVIVKSNFNKICCNNFIGNKIDHARFVCSYRNKWCNNYWDNWIGLRFKTLRFLPKAIPGSLTKQFYWSNLWFNFDKNPTLEPTNYCVL